MNKKQEDTLFAGCIGFVLVIFGGLLMDTHFIFTGIAVTGFGLCMLIGAAVLSYPGKNDTHHKD